MAPQLNMKCAMKYAMGRRTNANALVPRKAFAPAHDFVRAGILALALVGLGRCASNEIRGADVGIRFDNKAYTELINKNTRHAQKYEGFYNKYEVYGTFLNSEVQNALLQKKSDSLQWDAKTAQKERERLFQENATQTKFAISFFVPSPRLNDLHKGNSIWKTYLEAGGQRYEGRVTRRNGKLEDFQALFPYHNRWSVAYDVTFNVPLSSVEKGPVTFVLTSTQGTARLEF